MSVEIIDMGWGDLRLKDAPQTRVSQQQVEKMEHLGAVDAGASEVRFGGVLGDLLVECADGQWWEVAPSGAAENVNTTMGLPENPDDEATCAGCGVPMFVPTSQVSDDLRCADCEREMI